MKLQNGQEVTAAIVTNYIRPATKRLNRISDFNVCAITTGQLRYGNNKYVGVEQNKVDSIDLIPNVSSVQVLVNGITAYAFDPLYRIKKELEYINAMVV